MKSRGFFLVSVLTLTAAWNPPSGRLENKKKRPLSRRQVNQQLLFGGGILLVPTSPAAASEIGAKINAAVTKSDLGISVRRSVVKGAQIMDGMDGQWERFSDRFHLGSNRARQADKPLPKVIPPVQPLDGVLAARLLQVSDGVFVAVTKISDVELDKQIDKVTFTVAPSYERAGLNAKGIDANNPRNGDEFNFLTYTHYKAYTDLILEQNIDFRSFQKDFEERIGAKVEQLLLSKSDNNRARKVVPGNLTDPRIRKARWTAAQDSLQRLGNALVQRGLVAQIDSTYDEDDLADWLDDDAVSDLKFNVALDGDITLRTQCLLQEQGFRLYPNFGRYAIRNSLQQSLGTPVEITDYYMDTDYNSDPDKFQVKEVLLSIVLESG